MSSAQTRSPEVTLESHAHLAMRLRRLAFGARMELRGLGRSLWPIVESGARLEVERVPDAGIRRGEVVVAWVPAHRSLVCHVVTGIDPIRTAAVFGVDDGEVSVLARVVGVKGKGELRFRLAGAPHVVRLLRRTGVTIRERGWAFRLRARAEVMLGTGGSVALRRAILGPFVVRRLGPADLEALAVFVGHHLPGMSAPWLEGQLRGAWCEGRGGSVGAFDARGRLRAFGCLGRYLDEQVAVPGYWLRYLYTAPLGRKLGAMRSVVSALLELAVEQGHHEVFSDVREGNARSLALHRVLGFKRLPPADLAPFEPLLTGRGGPGREPSMVLRWVSPAAETVHSA